MNKQLLAHLAAAAAALCAGVAVVATRFVVGETGPVTLAFLRYLIGIACFAPLMPFLWPKRGVTLGDYGVIAGLGILFFVLFPWAFNASLQYVPAARGAVGLATIPVQTLVVAALFGRETLTAAKLVGVGLAFGGVTVVFGPEAIAPSGDGYLIGDGLMLLGVLCAAIYSVFGRPTLARLGPLFVTALAMAFAVVALAPLAWLEAGGLTPPLLSAEGWVAVVFLGTFAGAVQFSLFTWALRWLPPTTTVLYLTLSPVTAMILGVALIGEDLSSALVSGLALVLLGILVGNGVIGRPARPAPERRAD